MGSEMCIRDSVWTIRPHPPQSCGGAKNDRWTDLRVNQSPLMMGGTGGALFRGFRGLLIWFFGSGFVWGGNFSEVAEIVLRFIGVQRGLENWVRSG